MRPLCTLTSEWKRARGGEQTNSPAITHVWVLFERCAARSHQKIIGTDKSASFKKQKRKSILKLEWKHTRTQRINPVKQLILVQWVVLIIPHIELLQARVDAYSLGFGLRSLLSHRDKNTKQEDWIICLIFLPSAKELRNKIISLQHYILIQFILSLYLNCNIFVWNCIKAFEESRCCTLNDHILV